MSCSLLIPLSAHARCSLRAVQQPVEAAPTPESYNRRNTEDKVAEAKLRYLQRKQGKPSK